MADAAHDDLTIDQLARLIGLSVRNIRSHHARGLLPPPEVRARVGYYGSAHVERLRLIRELQDEGLKLEGIKRLLDESGGTGEGLLRVKEAADAAEAEEPQMVTADELQQRLEVPESEAARTLAKAEKLGLLVPLGNGLFEAPAPSLLDAAEEAHQLGIDVTRALEVVGELDKSATSVSRRFVKLFLEEIWKPFAEDGMPEEQWPDIAEAMQRLRPLAARALLGVFQQTMSREIETTFADLAKRLSEGKR